MSNVYTLDGIPSDLLSSNVINGRRLKVEATLTEAPASDSLANTAFTYDIDGNIATKIVTDQSSLIQTLYTYTWTSGSLTSIVQSII